MANSLEDILGTLLSQPKSQDILRQIIPPDKQESDSQSEKTEPDEKVAKIQRKIELLKAVEPLLGEKNKEYINLFIKALTIAKVLSEIEIN